jgi:hypothetical protein
MGEQGPAMNEKRNILGVSLCGVYCATTAACLLLANASGVDPDGRFILKQPPLAMQAGFLHWLGVLHFFDGLSWFQAYAIFFPSTLGLLYGLGWLAHMRRDERSARKEDRV